MSTGAASALAWTGAATAVIAGASLLGTGMLAQARAATAADLAALAAADAMAVGSASPCAVAEDAARRNGARLISCVEHGDEVVVHIRVDASVLPAVDAAARAGPAPDAGR
ncbi:hypothetical protein M3G50_12135 [Brachybacterium muris]|uniref:Rv3654c family TadE-like protein n=1 Tax=Brachybacterium muris TaxID=219301 RepID=UPI0021A70EB8|nr:Rv3654c family TadE-like protein [Brachybacterium muris]MCT1431490.1 hypothetical protein [Brachybacterium muris]